ncbi:MAG: amidohydrolase family protein [Nitrosopumilus sp.]|nr:amidohydrolase family protein [Nitrosopumilus sp.]
MTKVIINANILYGNELQIIKNGMILINNEGIIEKAGRNSVIKESNYYSKVLQNKNTNIIDARGYIIIPGLVNSHTHIGDAIGKDISSNSDLDTRVHPNHSIKKTILEKTETNQLMQSMKNAAISMLNKGITTFVDFREGDLFGIHLLQTAIKDVPIKSFILGRIDFSGLYKNMPNKNNLPVNNNMHLNTRIKKNNPLKKNKLNEKDVYKRGKEILNLCNGFGISGANENDDKLLTIYKNIIKKTNKQNIHNKKEKSIVAIHAAESDQTVKESLNKTGKTEIERTILTLEPDLYVHVTNPTKQDLDLLYSANKGIIICPRANGILGAGFTPVREMLKRGFNIAIGTDNVMLNSPDIFKEMDYLLKSQRAYEKNISFLDAKMVLKMTTINSGRMFNRNIGCIDTGYQADLIFIDEYDIDLYPMHDPYMSIVHRCSERAIKAIMIDGKFIHEKCRIN